MTGAEFDTRRRMLGLSVIETGAVCHNRGKQTTEKSVRRWISGENPVPNDAIEKLDALETDMQLQVDQLVHTVTNHTVAGPLVIRRYRDQAALDDSIDGGQIPLGAHAVFAGWAADALRDEGVDATIEWADLVD